MSDAFVTIDQFNEVLARLGKLEHKEQYAGKHEDIYKNVEELKEKYYKIDKRTEVTDTKIDSLRTEMHVEFKAVRTEMHNEFKNVRIELRITLGAILAVLIIIGIKLIFYS